MATQLQIIVNMLAASVGTGILSMPWSTAGASLLPAMLIILVVAVLMVVTIRLIIRAGERHQKSDIGNLLGLLPGSAGFYIPIVVNITLWGTLWLTLVGYVISIADALKVFLPGREVEIKLVSSAIILPLCFLDMSRLSITSTFSMLAAGNLYVMSCYMMADKIIDSTLPDNLCWFGVGEGIIAMVGSACSTMVVQMCALQMYFELDERTPEKFELITLASFAILFLLYSSFSAMGYLSYGEAVNSNVLEELPDGIWGKTTRIAYVVVLLAAYPIYLYPMSSSIKNSESLHSWGVNIHLVSGAATVAIVMTVAIAGCALDDLGALNAFIGAIQLAVFVGLCPGLIGMYLLHLPNHLLHEPSTPESGNSVHSSFELTGTPSPAIPSNLKGVSQQSKLLMTVLIVFCCIVGALGVVFTDNYVGEINQGCRWAVFEKSNSQDTTSV